MNYSALVAQLMGLVGQQNTLMPVAEKFNPLAKTLNPSAGLEGARMPSGGGGRGTSTRTTPVDVARSQLEAEMYAKGRALKERFDPMREGPMKLIPDHVKKSPEYQAMKGEYDRAFAVMRAFNTKFKPPAKGR